jgi:hypothetical protein
VRRHSEYFELVLILFISVLGFLLKPIFDHLYSNAMLAWLAQFMKIPEAELIERLSAMILPLMGASLVTWGLYRFLKRELTREFRYERAQPRLRLADLRTEGVKIRNEGQYLRAGLEIWIAECADWTNRVIQTITEINPSDAEWFKTLDAVPAPRIVLRGSYNPLHIKTYREHDFYLVKLEELIKKYPPIS